MTQKDRNNPSESQGLPRARILRGRNKFDQLFSDGKVIHGNNIMLRYYLHDEIPTFYMAFIVAKRLGKAVYRNKIKRRMREAYRRNLFLLDEFYEHANRAPGLYGAFLAKSIDLSYARAENDIVMLLEKLIGRIQSTCNRRSR